VTPAKVPSLYYLQDDFEKPRRGAGSSPLFKKFLHQNGANYGAKLGAKPRYRGSKNRLGNNFFNYFSKKFS
jgi:hypothetical protein